MRTKVSDPWKLVKPFPRRHRLKISKVFFSWVKYKTLWMIDPCVQRLSTASSSSGMLTVWDCWPMGDHLPRLPSHAPCVTYNKHAGIPLGLQQLVPSISKNPPDPRFCVCVSVCHFFLPSPPLVRVSGLSYVDGVQPWSEKQMTASSDVVNGTSFLKIISLS